MSDFCRIGALHTPLTRRRIFVLTRFFNVSPTQFHVCIAETLAAAH
jgi:hypothetical protein